MKKCPVCGVEHSDIVPVCSICGSSLENAEIIPDAGEQTPSKPPASEQAADLKEVTIPKPETTPTPDFSVEDIQAAVSSVVSAVVEQDKKASSAPVEEDPFDDDSPFVENVMKEKQRQKEEPAQEKAKSENQAAAPKTAQPSDAQQQKPARTKKTQERPVHTQAQTASTRKPAARKRAAKPSEAQTQQPAPSDIKAQSDGKKARTPRTSRIAIDTTAVAAASAEKVRAAKENAVAARERNMQAAEQQNTSGFDWSERKHKRNQSKSTPIIAAACALLALLIVAMVILLGKMMLGDGTEDNSSEANNGVTSSDVNDVENEDTQNTDTDANGTEDEDQQDTDTDTDGADADAENQDDTVLTENDPNAEDGTDTDTTETEETTDDQEQQDADTTDDQQEEETQQTEQPELPAITEVNETVYATSAVRVRDYPSTQYGEVINALAAGQSVQRTGTTSTGWSRVEIGNTVGYVYSSYLSTTKPSSDASDESSSSTAYAVTGVNVRETPNGTVIATLTEGQQVTLTGTEQGGWVQIKTGSITGYVYESYLSTSQSGNSTSSSDESDVKVTETNDTVYATTGVNVRDYPSSSSGNVIATLTSGQQVTRIGTTSSGWSKIKVGNVTGYVYSSYLSTSKPGSGSGSSTQTGYILPESNTRVYSKSELSSLSASQLRLARNEIYARHGRKFNDADLQEYFNNCSWYSGTVDPATFDANVTSYLNSYELANLQLITELEG